MHPTNNHALERLAVSLIALALCASTGCNTVQRETHSVTPTVVPGMEREERMLPGSVALVVDKEFTSYGITRNIIGGRIVHEIGGPLSTYARNVAYSVCKEVKTCYTVPSANNLADLILIPKVVRSNFEVTYPLRVLVCVEWLAKDRTGEKVVWLTTVEGESVEPMGGINVRSAKQRALQKAFDDLTLKTVKAFQESAELKEYMAKKPI